MGNRSHRKCSIQSNIPLPSVPCHLTAPQVSPSLPSPSYTKSQWKPWVEGGEKRLAGYTVREADSAHTGEDKFTPCRAHVPFLQPSHTGRPHSSQLVLEMPAVDRPGVRHLQDSTFTSFSSKSHTLVTLRFCCINRGVVGACLTFWL